jgi:hypothetical protein
VGGEGDACSLEFLLPYCSLLLSAWNFEFNSLTTLAAFGGGREKNSSQGILHA